MSLGRNQLATHAHDRNQMTGQMGQSDNRENRRIRWIVGVGRKCARV
jgi:hypothetical protein